MARGRSIARSTATIPVARAARPRSTTMATRSRPVGTRTSICFGMSACPVSRRSPAAFIRPAIGVDCGRCGCSPDSGRPRTRTRGSARSSMPARPGSRSPTTCRPCTATTRIHPRRKASSGRAAWRSAASPTWRSCSPGCRSTGSAPR